MTTKQLEKQIGASGDALGQMMTAARQRLSEAKKTKDNAKIKSALKFYNRCAGVMQNALTARIKDFDDSPEMQNLIDALKEVNGELKAEAKKIRDLRKGIQKATSVVKKLEKWLGKTLAFIA